MFTTLHRWAIEVDQNQQQRNPAAERDFIRDFGKQVYRAVEWLPALRHVYFTRIFHPSRDRMGAYVRLHFFACEPGGAVATAELDRMLQLYRARNLVFQIRKQTIDGVAVEARLKGAESFPELYYAYMETLSRTAVQLFREGVTDAEMDKIVKEWGHNLSNLLLDH